MVQPSPEQPSGAVHADLYELTMADSFLRRGMTAAAIFSLFARSLPRGRGFLVAAGIEDAVDALRRVAFSEADIGYIAGVLGADAARRVGALRFTGSVVAVPEGSIVLANEPLLEVTAPLPEAQLVETLLLNQVTYQTAIATKAARCRIAAPRLELIDFAFRRTQGFEAAATVARVSAMVGFAATSNVDAARRFGLRASGTMAHSYVQAFDTEAEAFRAFAEDFPDRVTFLVDTYDTLDGVRSAIGVIKELGLQPPLAVRLDSGDLLALSRRARAVLDAAGLTEVRIVVSGGLDEFELARLVDSGAPVDAAGVGTRMGVSADAPSLDSAYKLVAYAERPVLKLSADKATLPGAKQVMRGDSIDGDVIALREESPARGQRALLREVMRDGRRTAQRASISDAGAVFERDLERLPASARDLRCNHPPEAAVSERLARLTAELTTRRGPAQLPESG